MVSTISAGRVELWFMLMVDQKHSAVSFLNLPCMPNAKARARRR